MSVVVFEHAPTTYSLFASAAKIFKLFSFMRGTRISNKRRLQIKHLWGDMLFISHGFSNCCFEIS